MLRRWAKLVVFAVTFAALWLVASPAMASGPLCDDRGATIVAPTPALIQVRESLVPLDDDCDQQSQELAFQRHRAPGERIVIADADAARPTLAFCIFPSPEGEALSVIASESPQTGVRDRVDRPPRI